jgi:beta-glucosidase
VTNTGSVEGAEVAQVYLSYPIASGEPPKVLRGFNKVQLTAGQSQTVVVKFTERDLSIWDVQQHGWALQTGAFQILVGASSRDIRLTGTINV